MARSHETIEPMTLENMRHNGVRSLDVSCWQCHHETILSADPWADDVPVPSFGPRMVCTCIARLRELDHSAGFPQRVPNAPFITTARTRSSCRS
jgi:hypothetical protein